MTNTNTNTDEIGKQAEIIVDCGIDGAECAAITSLSQWTCGTYQLDAIVNSMCERSCG